MSRPVVIVTGTSRGIGEALVKKLAASAHVVGISRSAEALNSLSKEVIGFEYVAGDVTNEADCQKVVNLAIEKHGRLDGLVLNAGVLEPVTKIVNSNVDEWKKLFDINFFSIVNLLKLTIPHLRGHGRVVFVSSGAAVGNYTAWGAYGSSKAALNHLAATLAVEEPSIFSISIAPGVVDTNMQVNIREQHGSEMNAENHAKFTSLKAKGDLLSPDVPAGILANLVLKGKGDNLSGKFFRYNSEEIAQYSD
ncbi:benzil reductase ((S)-benzoin forming) Irc24p [Trichomonascus vanleenenianus]|uniref:SDR family oxidoreductase n=1 Tax=Trichomonascus vanleenenianus TaxID=2268995 RepID=UPI003ECA79D5